MVKITMFSLLCFLLLGCNGEDSSERWSKGELQVTVDTEYTYSSPWGGGFRAQDEILISAAIISGEFVSYKWQVSNSDVVIKGNGSNEITITLPLINGYTELSRAGVKVTVNLIAEDSIGNIDNHKAALWVFPITKSAIFDEKAIDLGLSQDAIDQMCGTPMSSNGNYYNVKDTSVFCTVENDAPIVRITDTGYSCPKNEECSIEANLSTRNIFAKSATSAKTAKYGSLNTPVNVDSLSYQANFSNDEFPYYQMSNQANVDEIIKFDNRSLLWTMTSDLAKRLGNMSKHWH